MSDKKSLSLGDISSLSVFEVVILEVLLRHAEPVVRYTLYLEINHFFQMEEYNKKIFTEQASSSEILYFDFLKDYKKTSTSSFYNSLDNLEKSGLISYVRNDKDKVESVEKNEKTAEAVELLKNHFFRFGLTADYNSLTKGSSIVLKKVEKESFDSILFIWLYTYVDEVVFNLLTKISKSVYIICDKNLYETQIKDKYPNFTDTSIKNKKIFAPEGIVDLTVYLYIDVDVSVLGISRRALLKEAVRVTEKGAHIILVNYKKLEIPQDSAERRIIKMFNEANKQKVSDVEEFKKDLIEASLKEIEIITEGSYIFGLGKVP